MVLINDITIQQGDSQKVVIPVLDGDDPDAEFYPDIGSVTVEFSIAESLDASTALWVAPDGQISIDTFDSVKLGSEDFDFAGADADGVTIPDTQEVVIVDIPSSETATFSADTDLRYQCRFTDPNFSDRRLTPVKGSISVQGATPFTE